MVVGGGISGLAAAWRLARRPDPPRVVVLEQSARVGGKLLVGAVGDVEVDLGAESVLARRPEALELFADLGLGADVVHPATAAAKVVRDGVAHPLPTGTVMGVPGRPEVLAGVLTPAEIERVAAEPSPPPALTGGRPDGPSDRRAVADVDVASFVAGRLGPAVVDRLVEPLLGGVYAGRADRLSLRATVPAAVGRRQLGGAPARRRPPDDGRRPEPARTSAPGRSSRDCAGALGRLPLRLAERLAERRRRGAHRGDRPGAAPHGRAAGGWSPAPCRGRRWSRPTPSCSRSRRRPRPACCARRSRSRRASWPACRRRAWRWSRRCCPGPRSRG